jgi:capsular exopolysaccharide synthesis family protein
MEIENKLHTREQRNFVESLIFWYFPYWPLFVVLVILMLGLAWGYLHMATPVYQTTATILIKDEKKGVDNSPAIQSLNIYTSKKIVENEIEVIKSKTLMRETVDKLGLAFPVYQETLFGSTSAYTSSPVRVELRNFNKFKEVPKVEFLFDVVEQSVVLNRHSYKLNEWINSEYGEIRFLKNDNLEAMSQGPFFFSLLDPRRVTNDLLNNLSVQPTSKLSTVISLSIKDVVPIRGENILNTLLQTYGKAAVDDKNKLVSNTLKFIEDRIGFVEKDLDSVEQEIQEYKATRGIVDLSEQGKLFLQNVGANDQKLAQINMQMAVLDQVEEYVVNKRNSAGIVPATLGIEDKGLSMVIQKLHQLDSDYERLKKTTAENNPILASLSNEIQSMRPGILENIRGQRFSLIASRKNLNSTNEKYTSVLQSIPKKERELLEVNRQQAIKNNVYTFLLQKREETALSYASTVGDSRVVDKAERSMDPISPRKSLVYIAAIGVAILIGFGWISIKELYSSKVLFRSEIEAATNIPIVAEISHIPSTVADVSSGKHAYLMQQFQHLRAAIGFYGKTSKKIVMFTSSIPSEGKSFLCSNFAASLARSGRKILLLDLDLRNPTISKFHKVNDAMGISDYFAGTAKISESIKPTLISNLYVIGAGTNLSSPTETLMNFDISDLFEQLRTIFDYIIVDTAPIDPVTDAYLISPYCDVTLFVLRHNKTPKTMLQLLKENERTEAFKNVSIVFNAVRSRGLLNKDYGYGLGYGYKHNYKERKRV